MLHQTKKNYSIIRSCLLPFQSLCDTILSQSCSKRTLFLINNKQQYYSALSMSKPDLQNNIRNKPFVVICGCTGTGKTKLSIEIAKWLIETKGKKAEIINADAMQMYRNLEIITNKATVSEMNEVKHHLIGFLDQSSLSHNVSDYQKRAVSLIDEMLANDIVPILVGGSHYYIQSVIWNILIDSKDRNDLLNTEVNSETPKQVSNLVTSDNENSSIVKLIIECLSGVPKDIDDVSFDLNVRIHDSSISDDEIYQQLQSVDLESARRIHPNDRRKLCRALQIYYTHGKPKSELLNAKNNKSDSLRYKNTCLFALDCETETLNKRLDQRVDSMISQGLLKEINQFKEEFVNKYPNQTFKNYSRDFTFGIFQSIGFKEFDEYLNHKDQNSSDNNIISLNEQQLFSKCTDEMKASTRRYARSQVKWVQNRFIKRACKHSPIVHKLDATNLENWSANVFDKAIHIFDDYLARFAEDSTSELNKISGPTVERQDIFQFNRCEECKKVFVNKYQWQSHLNGGNHKKRIEHLKRKKQQQCLIENLETLKKMKQSESVFTETPLT